MRLNYNDLDRCGIYAIRNKVNNKLYIGKSINIHKRMIVHKSQLKAKDKNENRHLINSYHKHGDENFEYYVIEYLTINDEILSEKELYWMEYYKTHDRNFGYNLRLDSSSKCIVNDETKKQLSISGKSSYMKDPNRRIKVSENSSKFWRENPNIKNEMAKKLKILKRRWKFEQYTMDMVYIKTWDNLDEVIEANPGWKKPPIYGVCSGTKNSYRGFKWKKIARD